MTYVSIGCDLSKDTFDAWRQDRNEHRQFENTAKGFKVFLAWIKDVGCAKVRVIYEPTGAYHRDFELALSRAGLGLVKVNPLHARRFAEACSQLTKTDKLDAQILAKMGDLLDLQPKAPPSELMYELKELHGVREALVREQVAKTNKLAQVRVACVKRMYARRIALVKLQIVTLEKEIQTRIKADPDLHKKMAILKSIPGIGELTAAMLLIEMPELGTLDPKKIAKLAGLAAIKRQSGKWEGQARIQAGRAVVRRGLYMPALTALRRNADLKAVFLRLTSKGLPAKKAIVAVMRKLLLLANTKLKTMQPWTPKTA